MVGTGGGITTWGKIGKRVASTRKLHNGNHKILGGSYQQYMIADAMTCLTIPDDMPFTTGSMHVVNPLTAMGLVQRIKDNKSVAAIQTGAASQCGRMIIKLC